MIDPMRSIGGRLLIGSRRARGERTENSNGKERIASSEVGGSVLLSVADLVSDEHFDKLVRLDEAVRRLEAEDPDVAQVVRLRFYAGLSGNEAASALGKFSATVDRDWSWARAWLFRQRRPTGL